MSNIPRFDIAARTTDHDDADDAEIRMRRILMTTVIIAAATRI